MTPPIPSAPAAPPTVPASSGGPSQSARDAAQHNNAFATDLFAQLDKSATGKNLLFSPYSISAVLAMTAQGARAKTADQMNRVLHIPADTTVYQSGMGDITAALNPQNAPFELAVSNNLWVDQTFPLAANFVRDAKAHYAAGVVPVDFAHQAEAARKQINGAIAAQTHDKIQDLLPPGAVDSSTALVLTNAIYFKGAWQLPFSRNATTDQPFHAPDGDQTVPMMRSSPTAFFAYAETDDAQLLALPYKGAPTAQDMTAPGGGPLSGPSTLSMLILLPKKPDGLADLEKQVTADTLAKWTSTLRSQPVQVFLPRFTMTDQFNLSAVLQAMGMTDAFTPAADFSGISDSTQNKLYISAVVHKTFIDVNEEGTEAAAASGIAMAGAARPAKRVEFRADHPFLFLIRHDPTNSILFMGHVNSIK